MMNNEKQLKRYEMLTIKQSKLRDKVSASIYLEYSIVILAQILLSFL